MFGKIKEMLSLEKWIENFEGYMDARIELIKFDIREAAIKWLSKSIMVIGMIFFGFSALVLLNFGIAGVINQIWDSQFLGFFVLSGFYFVIALIFYFLRNNSKWIQKLETDIRASMQKDTAENEPNT